MNIKDNSKLSSIEKIDFVLNYLSLPENKGKYHTITDMQIGEMKFYNRPNFYESITQEDLVLIVMKLIEERRVVEFTKVSKEMPDEIRFSTNLFRITFDGLLWRENGGYQGEIDRNNLAERRVRISQTLTWILAVGVVTPSVWYLLDVSRNYYNASLRFFVYLVGFSSVCSLALFLYKYPIKKLISKIRK